jgi:general secretion pathway protein F
VYICRVANESGKIEEYRREAASEESCLRELSAHGAFVLSVRALSGDSTTGKGAARFSRKSLSEITDIVTLMLGSGLSLKDSLEVAQGVFVHGETNALITLLLEKLRKGSTFASALETTGTGIPPFYSGMVRIGERIGTLDQVFTRLSTFLKEEKTLRDRFSSALIYPCIVLGVAGMSAVFIVAFLFPRLREIFSDLGPSMGNSVQTLMGALQSAMIIIGILVVYWGWA